MSRARRVRACSVATGCRDGCARRFFFFQAEDGIRDYKVTGVQTCALPISGFNVDFAPVVDIRLPHSIITDRCLASSPLEVARLAAAFIEELSKRGVVTCAKHFPGLGGAVSDPHFSLPRIERTKRQIQYEDAIPFVRLFDQIGMIMICHAHYPSLGDDKPTPASLSSRVIGGLLRKKLGYKG